MLLGREVPDLLVLDQHMPGLDGFSVLRVLRDMPGLDGMQTVIVTGLDASELKRHDALSEAIQILPKPIPFAELEKIAERTAARRHHQAANKA